MEEPVKEGVAKGLVSGLNEMLPEYYELRGWDQNGVPTNQTLVRLELG
jgi:aldehyde:ferredoxin oxidoreductase